MRKEVTAIVPCYNEAPRVGAVLKVLTTSPEIQKVIVVDNCSTDSTEEVVKKFDVKLISNKKNIGKGGSVKKAANYVDTEIVMMCDADLKGLTHEHIKQLIEPVKKDINAMAVGLRDKHWQFGRDEIKKKLMPMYILISGERALATRHLREACKNKLSAHYGLELVMNFYCKKKGIKIKRVNLKGLEDVTKIKKSEHGLRPHIDEFFNVINVYAKLYLEEIKGTLDKLKNDNKKQLKNHIRKLERMLEK